MQLLAAHLLFNRAWLYLSCLLFTGPISSALLDEHIMLIFLWIIQHQLKETMEILRAAALVHDIGIKMAEEKYGSSAGKLQEKEGPPVARQMLTEIGYPQEVVDRVCYLVGHHHTYLDMDGMDYQILVEADFLVNLFENASTRKVIRSVDTKIFRTAAGRRILHAMFALDGAED